MEILEDMLLSIPTKVVINKAPVFGVIENIPDSAGIPSAPALSRNPLPIHHVRDGL